MRTKQTWAQISVHNGLPSRTIRYLFTNNAREQSSYATTYGRKVLPQRIVATFDRSALWAQSTTSSEHYGLRAIISSATIAGD